MTVWTLEQCRRWLAGQLRQAPAEVERRIEGQIAQEIVVESVPLPDILPLLDPGSRQFLEDALQRPVLTPAEEAPLLQQWLRERARIRSVLGDGHWWEPLWQRLEQLVKAIDDPTLPAEDREPVAALAQRASELQSQLAGLHSGLDRLLSLASIPPRLLQMLGAELLEGLGQAGRALDPVLGHRLRRTAALCWRYLPDPLHFPVVIQRPIQGLLAAVDGLDLPYSERLDARAGWLECLELERFLLQREKLAWVSRKLRKQLGRTPGLDEMAAASYDPHALDCTGREGEMLEERLRGEWLNSLLDHWEMDPNLFELGRAGEKLTRKETAQARSLRRPGHSLPEVRVLLLRYGLWGEPASLEETAERLALPVQAVRRLEMLAARKLE